MVNFTYNQSQPWTAAQVDGLFFNSPRSVARYYEHASNRKLLLTGKVLGWFTISASAQGCDEEGLADRADAAAGAAGNDLSGYNYKVYAFPEDTDCDWMGRGQIRGSRSWINGAPAMNLNTATHELGHNLGLGHAATRRCKVNGVTVPLAADSANCTDDEYGDPFTVMGEGNSEFLHHSWHRLQLGWIYTQPIRTSGMYRLAPVEFDLAGAPRIIWFPRDPFDGHFFALEFRQPFSPFDALGGFFPQPVPLFSGVTVRLGSPAHGWSKLLDMTPSTETFDDAPLAVGQTFTDPASGLRITTNAISPTGADVFVYLPRPDLVETAAAVRSAPANSPPRSFIITDTVSNRGAWTASNSVTRYYLSRDQVRAADDTLIRFGTRLIPGLGAGESSRGSVGVTISSSVRAGTYYVIACADEGARVAEESESNNCTASKSFAIN